MSKSSALQELATLFAGANREVTAEILRQAECHMAGLIENARAADQRAATVSGIQMAATLAILAFATSLPPDGALSAAVYVSAMLMFASGLFSAATLRPRKFYLLGNSPLNWVPDIKENRSLSDCLADTILFYDHAIDANALVLEQKARMLSIGLWLTAASPVAAVSAFALQRWFAVA